MVVVLPDGGSGGGIVGGAGDGADGEGLLARGGGAGQPGDVWVWWARTKRPRWMADDEVITKQHKSSTWDD